MDTTNPSLDITKYLPIFLMASVLGIFMLGALAGN